MYEENYTLNYLNIYIKLVSLLNCISKKLHMQIKGELRSKNKHEVLVVVFVSKLIT